MSRFILGTATSSFQIEGGAGEHGRTPSIWDTFCGTPGKIDDSSDGLVACDHFHLYRQDIALMKELGVDSYRFSIAWPRIFPRKGEYCPQGMQFYKDILDELERQGIAPAITLYHWDLPQWAQEEGGWENRQCVQWFVDYAVRCFQELGRPGIDWITHNEPWCTAFMGNLEGEHAPGYKDLEKSLRVGHHVLVSHGLAVQKYRELGTPGRIGITLNLAPAYGATDQFADQLAAKLQDAYQNRWFLDPVFRGTYPADLAALFAARCATEYDFILPGDLELASVPCDFLGINFYTRNLVKYCPSAHLLKEPAYSDYEVTDMGWDICPETLGDVIRQAREYTSLPILITENGSAWRDEVEDGQVHDPGRVDYLLRHLQAVEQLNAEGLNIEGYFYWSFLDNFEWARGYTKRFGIVYVDYQTQQRIPKGSFYAFQKYIAQRR